MIYIDTALKGKKKINSIHSEGKNKFTQFLWLQVIIITINYFPSVRSCKTKYMNNRKLNTLIQEFLGTPITQISCSFPQTYRCIESFSITTSGSCHKYSDYLKKAIRISNQ